MNTESIIAVDSVTAAQNKIKETLIQGLQISGITDSEIIVSDLLLAAMGAREVHSRCVEDGKVRISGRGTFLVYKLWMQNKVELGYRVFELTADGVFTLVGERIRTPEAAKLYDVNPNHPGAHEFLSLWAHNRVRGRTRELRIAQRELDTVLNTVAWAHHLFPGTPMGKVFTRDLVVKEPTTRDPVMDTLAMFQEIPEALESLRLLELRGLARALGVKPVTVETDGGTAGLSKDDYIGVIRRQLKALIKAGFCPAPVATAFNALADKMSELEVGGAQ